ncbi:MULTISPECIES: CAP domain-containing protein [unclassified Paenibacillus]|uniref:CAP domain-containing protein n=1 Tax=unclassified Paenibacillus TaxID=185978 RepID=UPI0030FC8DD8
MKLDNRKGLFAARIRGRSVIAGAGALLLLLTGWFGGGAFGAAPHAYAADSGKSGYTSDQLEAVDFLNEVRAKIGVQPVTLNREITQAAEAHAKYYNANKEGHPGLDPHSEKEGNEGFTGASVKERIRAAGWSSGSNGAAYGEVMHFKQNSSSSAIQGWLDSAYHRDIVLSPRYSEIGIGLVDGTAVVDMAGKGFASAISGGISFYPYDGQTEVPVGFYGNEIPNPLDQFGAEYSGYIVSATAATKITSYEAAIKDENGEEVAYFDELYSEKTLFLFPKKVLKGNHTYTVTLNYRTEASSGNQTKTWSFTTGKGSALIALKPEFREITLNEGGPYRSSFQAVLDDGRSEAVESGITFVSSDPKGLQISADGVLTGLKAGDYKIKATLDGNTTQLKVKVYPKWKTKTYSAAAANLPSDISGHPLQASLEWGLKGGMISPAKDGLLHPDETVSEAEFWTMLLKSYSVNIDAYQSAKATHWADGAYAIAKSRNYPLAGIANAAARSNPVTRRQVAEIVAAADGVNAKGSNAITYVLAKDYVQGVTELSISGFESSKQLTRGEALQILQHLRQTLGELRGRPVNETPPSSLPKLPQRKLYAKPAQLEDRSLYAEFREDRKLIVEGKFKEFAGQSMVLKVQEKQGSISKHIEDVNVTFDNEGKFHVEAGPYTPDALNLYLYAPEITYFISVQYNTFVDNHYSE